MPRGKKLTFTDGVKATLELFEKIIEMTPDEIDIHIENIKKAMDSIKSIKRGRPKKEKSCE